MGAPKGRIPWNKGLKIGDRIRKKKLWTIKVCPNCTVEFSSYPSQKKKYCSKTCMVSYIKKYGISDDHRKNLVKNSGTRGFVPRSAFKKGNPAPETAFKKGQFAGSKHPKWIEDRTAALENKRDRNSAEYKLWRTFIFSRDKFTCQECYVVGEYLEAHHIIPVRENKSKLINVTNGITLCQPCHKKTFGKESNFVEKYSLLVAAQG